MDHDPKSQNVGKLKILIYFLDVHMHCLLRSTKSALLVFSLLIFFAGYGMPHKTDWAK